MMTTNHLQLSLPVMYRNKARGSKKNKRFQLIFIVILVTGASYLLFATNATTTPADALARAVEFLNSSRLEEAKSLLQITAQDKRIEHWASLLLARIQEAEGHPDKALNLYRSISLESAASLDARIAILRLQAADHKGNSTNELGDIESEIKRANRPDLAGQLLLVMAVKAKAQRNLPEALKLYDTIRTNHPGTELARQAASDREQLIADNKYLPGLIDVEGLLRDARLLTLEGLPLKALERVQEALILAGDKTPQFYHCRLAEIDILRKLKRYEEADHVLLLISADGPPEVAEQAILLIAKNAWNINDNHRALTFVESLEERFPASPLVDEATYIKGRILEEIDQLAEAKDVFIRLSEKSINPEIRTQALQRLAWLFLRNHNYFYAAEYFFKLRTASSEPKTVNHAQFWETFALTKLEKEDLAKLSYKPEPAEQLVSKLANGNPVDYYTNLTRTLLFPPAPVRNGALNQKPASLPFNTPKSEAAPPCQVSVPAPLRSTLELLSSNNLLDFSQYEIDWFAFQQLPSLLNSQALDQTQLDLRTLVTRATLYAKYAHLNAAVGVALNNLQRDSSSSIASMEQGCAQQLLRLAYPQPHYELFAKSARETGVPIELLLAIAHTESHFAPDAQSKAGAMGLMQLLPQTATMEGLAEKQNLLSPQINIALGAKHVARLLGDFDGNQTFAIAAYNAGTTAVNRWRTRYPQLEPELWIENVGYPETKEYLKKVSTAAQIYGKRLTLDNEASSGASPVPPN